MGHAALLRDRAVRALDAGLEEGLDILEGCEARLREVVVPEHLASALAEGQALALEDAVELAQAVLKDSPSGDGAAREPEAEPAI